MIKDVYEVTYYNNPEYLEFLYTEDLDGNLRFIASGKEARDIFEKLLYVVPNQITTPVRPIKRTLDVTVYFNNDTSSPEFADMELVVNDRHGFTRKFYKNNIRDDKDLFTIVKRYFSPFSRGSAAKKNDRGLLPDFKAIYDVTYYENVKGKFGDRIPPRVIVRRHGDKNVLSAYTGKTAEAFVKEFAAPVETGTNGVYGFIVKIIVREDEYLLLTYRNIPYSDPVSATRERDMNRDLMKKFFDFDDFA